MFTSSFNFQTHHFIYCCVFIEHIVVSFAYKNFQLGMQFLLDRTWFISKYMIYLIH
jgi:Pre-mRNA 3''-end processing (cleavage and polyadenylation) factor